MFTNFKIKIPSDMLTWSLRNIRNKDFKYRNKTSLTGWNSEEVKNEGKIIHSTVLDMKTLI